MADTTATVTNDETSMIDQTTGKTTGNRGRAKSGVRSVKDKLAKHGGELRGQAEAKAREYAEQGKEKATGALDGVSRFFDDTANTLDDQLGAGLGDYVHRAADAVAGFTETLKQKDVEELLTDARDAVRRNPALAIGAAAAVGFVLVRLIKSAASAENTGSTAPRSGKTTRTGTTGS